jgi:hypothetical protein
VNLSPRRAQECARPECHRRGDFSAELLEVTAMEKFENSMKILPRLAPKHYRRVRVPPGREETFVRAAEFVGRVG